MFRFTTRRFCATVGATGASGSSARETAAVNGESKKNATADQLHVSAEEQAAYKQYLKEYGREKDGEVLDADGLLPPLPQPATPYKAPPPFPHRARKGIETPEYYNSRSAIGHPDPLAVELTAGRSDPEWQWLKLLCFLCVVPTFGSWLYAIFFPANAKWFKDEPWSPFRN